MADVTPGGTGELIVQYPLTRVRPDVQEVQRLLPGPEQVKQLVSQEEH